MELRGLRTRAVTFVPPVCLSTPCSIILYHVYSKLCGKSNAEVSHVSFICLSVDSFQTVCCAVETQKVIYIHVLEPILLYFYFIKLCSMLKFKELSLPSTVYMSFLTNTVNFTRIFQPKPVTLNRYCKADLPQACRMWFTVEPSASDLNVQ